MSDDFLGPGSAAGEWRACLEPMFTRRLVLHLVRETPARANELNGKMVVTPAQAFEVELVMRPLAEGRWAETPTMASADHDVLDFMQAIVDEAAKVGIVARNGQGQAELKRVEKHLGDMRAIVAKTLDVRL